MKIDANLIRSGNILRHKGKLLQVLNTSIIKPGKGGAFIQVEMKDILDGTKYNERWRTVDSVEKASVNEVEATFLFKDSKNTTVMNNTDYEQIICENKLIGDDKIKLLEEGMIVKILTVDDEIVSINLPKNIKVEILNADAVVKGQTASSSFKNAETTKNVNLLVPPHIKIGDKIIINSENLEYVEKAKD